MSSQHPVTLLALDVSGRAGVARAVVNLANRLVEHRPVRLITVMKRSSAPTFAIHPRVEVEVLVENRHGTGMKQQALAARPTKLRPRPADTKLSRLTDEALRKRLAALEPGVLVSSRPSLHLAAATWAAPGVRLVGWDHKNFPTRMSDDRKSALLRDVLPRLDAYVVLTYADAADYQRELRLHDSGTAVRVIRNILSWDVTDSPAPLDNKVVLAAGRLVREKGFDRMVKAFAPVARAHPDWQLHIYGEGRGEYQVQARIDQLELAEQVRLMGYTPDLATAMSNASVFAMTSRAEGLPMVLVEAMSRGLPLVAMDCPRGPGEIVVDGKNGFLVGDGDLPAFRIALRTLVEKDDVRRRLGRQAHEDAHQYDAESVVAEWLGLFEELEA